jgi:hypothetical protein
MDNTGICPWCDMEVVPVRNDGTGDSVLGYTDKATWMARNPAMCPECNLVAGWEDFGIDF